MNSTAHPATDGEDMSRVPWPIIKGTAKVMVAALLLYLLLPGVISGFSKAWSEIRTVNPAYLAAGFAIELTALFCYSLLTRSALPPGIVSPFRLFRIQLSTRALSSTLPAGSAAGSALGYRLLTASGVSGPDAGFALATVGLGSAVVLNVLFFVTVVVTIPSRGLNPRYLVPAIAGLILLVVVASIVIGLLKGQQRAERVVRALSRRLRFEPDRAVEVIRSVAERLRGLTTDRRLLSRVIGWAAANWLLDAAALWVFLRAFGGSLSVDGLLIAFCAANIVQVVPLTPGGIGIVEAVYVPLITAFGLSRANASVGVTAYRAAQLWFPIVLGAICYLSLRVGPWSIDRRESLKGIREEAQDARNDDTSGIEWAEKYGRRVAAGAAVAARSESQGEPPSP